ncbi:MAG: undecaprenyl-diphosphate phosphatase [Candidatus Hodarchaeales archaeon]|jgi:undecaprenyl-diphosphatase
MIDLLAAILMALFQGIFEWLPISSEGQLSLLFVTIYGLDELAAVTLALFLHLGTMMAVIWYFRQDLIEMIKSRSPILEMMVITTFGTALTAVPLVLLFKTYWETFTSNLILPADLLFTILVGSLLIITGFVLSKQSDQGSRELLSLTKKEALFLGLAQGIAALPGISRSGMTITFLLVIGIMHRDAFKISFLISIPAVLGATVLEFVLEGFEIDIAGMTVGNVFIPFPLLVLSIVLTAIIGILTMNFLLSLKEMPYDKFCYGFGSVTILLGLLFFLIRVVSA